MKIITILVALFSISSAFARADVSLQNGNFYLSFMDMHYPGGIEPKILRVYNSKSDFIGVFGGGWSSEYEVKLVVELDGSVVVYENGGGATNRFMQRNAKPSDIDAGVNQLIEAAKKSSLVSTAAQVQAYTARLKSDASFRSKQTQLFIGKGMVPMKKLTEGTQLTSTSRSYQYITKVKGGFVRVTEGGGIEKFNEAGRLVQVQDRNKNFLNIGYNANGRAVQLIDNQNRKMNLYYNSQNLLEKVVGESGKTAVFKYSKDGLLEYSKDEDGVENAFHYTQDVYRNLNEIIYLSEKDANGKPKRLFVTYYGADKTVKVKSVLNTDGTSNEYDYVKDPKYPNYYGARVVLKNAAGTKISESKYDYVYKKRANGEDYISKLTSDKDGDKMETTYDDKLGFPVKINNNGRITTMEYDGKGRISKKVTPIETTELTYHPTVGKVTKVVKKLKSGTVIWSTFEWDLKTGNLTLASNSEKKQVKLIYDPMGRVRALVDQTGRQLTFKYNELSKPIEISDAKLGTIKITYKNSGEVDKMESNGGASAASEVLRALQNLIDITAPAGVTMSI